MKPFFITTILVSCISLTACKKDKTTDDDHTEEDHPTAVITITSPNENDTIQGNFSVTGNIVGTGNLHGYQVTVTNTSNDSIIYQNDIDDHVANFTINQAVTNPYSVYAPLKLVVVAALDHEGHTETKTVHFVVH
ncbi:hypothetical protein [Fluviicola chungangensis]|uniref:DUF4625 domain-containing protein n=1 Tax=Fluviicola chungangensis TaxID=2597671 RepID=A0A556N5W4_9FLAO|nr:hypothetical protein [Fluviicola chungangensis]TSJ47584.1 hypothetical protein FO442_00205 [Fluviicola chungangensis]